MNEIEKSYTIAEAVEITGMSEGWWRDRVLKKDIRYYKIGKNVRIPQSTIHEVVKVIEPRKTSKYQKPSD